mmetsp:Transcript_807/g.2888  ORF Transcript_807/g.2888 Transcript_807/m.2888 type:complete len:101 (-) Transcript_807:563-865(-)
MVFRVVARSHMHEKTALYKCRKTYFNGLMNEMRGKKEKVFADMLHEASKRLWRFQRTQTPGLDSRRYARVLRSRMATTRHVSQGLSDCRDEIQNDTDDEK